MFFQRFSHHIVLDAEDYQTLYGYDINELAQWSRENDPDWRSDKSFETLLSYTLNIYGHILTACLALDVESVLDIGSACSRQARMFSECGIDYCGLDPWENNHFYNEGLPGTSFWIGEYPASGNMGCQAAISSHCVGTQLLWPVDEIARDFDVFIGCCYTSFFEELRQLCDNYEVIECENHLFHPEMPREEMTIAACWR